jgi:very-short-patch-repair endonuclease
MAAADGDRRDCGRDIHATRAAFERDRERDAWLTAQGYRVVRFTWRRLSRDPGEVAKILRLLLSRPT